MRDYEREYPIHSAVRAHDVAQVRSLLAKGEDPNARDCRGLRPLEAVAAELPCADDVAIAEELIAAAGQTWAPIALDVAVRHHNLAIVGVLLRAGVQVARDWRVHDSTVLHAAVKLDDVEMVRLLLSYAHASPADETGATPLHYARSPSTAIALMEKGASVDQATDEGVTPLHIVQDGAVAGALIAHGASVHARDRAGRTPLHSASHPRTAKVLLKAGADLDAVDDSGSTPLLTLAAAGYASAAIELVKAGADLTVRDGSGRTPLLVAARTRGGLHLTKELIRAGADPLAVDGDGGSLLAGLSEPYHVWGYLLRYSPDSISTLLGDPHLWWNVDSLAKAVANLPPHAAARLTSSQIAPLLAAGDAGLRSVTIRMMGRAEDAREELVQSSKTSAV